MSKEKTNFKAGLFVDGNNIFRSDFPIDYQALYDFVAREHHLLRANAYIIVDPEYHEKSRPFVHFLMSTGFRVVQRPLIRLPDGSVRASTSVAVAVDMILQARGLDILVLVSGDGNLVPAIEEVQRQGRRVECIAFADRSSKDVQDAVDFFYPLQNVDNIQREMRSDEYRTFGGDDGDRAKDGDPEDDKTPEEL